MLRTETKCPFTVESYWTEYSGGSVTVHQQNDIKSDMTGFSVRCFSDYSPDTTCPAGPAGPCPLPTPNPTATPNPTPNPTCFAEDATVEVKNKGTASMKDLQVMDEVFAGTDANGKLIFQPVYGFGHYDRDSPNEYLQIHTSQKYRQTPGNFCGSLALCGR